MSHAGRFKKRKKDFELDLLKTYQQALNDYIDQLERALNKACEMLEMLRISQEKDTLVIGAMSMIEDDKYMSKENWKEWCMRDEE